MEPKEAAVIIDKIIESLRRNPGQFNINVNVSTAGAIGIGGPGGSGIVGIAQGGGTGFRASASAPSAAQIKIGQQAGLQQVSSELSQMLSVLEQLKTELLSQPPSKSKIKSFLDSIKGKWLPEVVVSVVSELITSTLGKL